MCTVGIVPMVLSPRFVGMVDAVVPHALSDGHFRYLNPDVSQRVQVAG